MAGSTPIYGFPYPQSTDLVADYPTLGQELATDVETVISGLGSGLNIVTPSSIANSGGTATRTNGQVVFTGVTSVSLNGVFSSAYDNYRIVYVTSSSAINQAAFRMRASGADASGSTDYNLTGPVVENTTSGFIGGTNSSSWTLATTARIYQTGSVDFYSPFLTTYTRIAGHTQGWDTTNNGANFALGGTHKQTVSYDGLTLSVSASNITGTIRVYGYKNS